MIYYLTFLVLIFFSFFEFYYKQERRVENTIVFYSIAIFLIFFAGFREVGFDYANYHNIFDTVNLSNYTENTVEVGFAFFVQVFNLLKLPFNLFLFFIALISIGIKAKFIKDFSPYYFLSLVIYFAVNFLLSDMGQIRHGLAMSIVLLSFYDIFNKNKTAFFIKVGIAYLFHATAVIVFPAYFIANIKKVTIWHILIPIIVLLPFMFIDIKATLAQFAVYLPSQVQSKIAYYTTTDEVFGERLGFSLTMFLRLAVIAGMYYYYEQGEKKIKYYRQILLLYVYGTILFMLFNSIAEMAVRFSNYFKILEFIILPMLVALGKNYFEKHLIIFITLLYAGWSIYKMLVDPITSIEYLPYKNALFN